MELSHVLEWGADCDILFSTLGINADAVGGRAEENFTFKDGTTSTDLQSSLYANSPLAGAAAAQFGNQTVQGFFATANPSVKAETALNAGGVQGGNVVYLNPQYWGADFHADRGTLLHELLHSLTGLTDSDFASKLGTMAKFTSAVKKCNDTMLIRE